MKKKKIVILIYDNNIYIKKNDKIDCMPLSKNAIENGRINNLKAIIRSIKKSRLVLSSFFKIINDDYTFIYFANYNEFEIQNIKRYFLEEGFENIKLLDFSSCLKEKDEYMYMIFNNNYYYIVENNNKYVLPKKYGWLMCTNSKIICDENAYGLRPKSNNLYQCFRIDNVVNYLLKHIC